MIRKTVAMLIGGVLCAGTASQAMAQEYTAIVLDKTGSMTLTKDGTTTTFWDNAVSAAANWVGVDKDDYAMFFTDRYYAVFTFRNGEGQVGLDRVWPIDGVNDAGCPATATRQGGFCRFASNAQYEALQTTVLESVRANPAVVGPTTPLAGSLCNSMTQVFTVAGPAVKTIVFESDGGENDTALDSACFGEPSADFATWNFSVVDWGMTPLSWQNRVVRRAVHINEADTTAVTRPLTSADQTAFTTQRLNWRVDVHYRFCDLPANATDPLCTSGSAPLRSMATSAFFAAPSALEGGAQRSMTMAAAAPAVATAGIASLTAEMGLFRSLGRATRKSATREFAMRPDAVYGVTHRIEGDVDDGGCVDQADLNIVMQKGVWMARAERPLEIAIRADLNRDGWVNVGDRDVVLANWARGCINPVPPPRY